MAGWPTTKNKINTSHKNRTGDITNSLKCLQINLQHSRLATDNILKILEEENTDIACIQEPYMLGNKIGGIPHSLTVLTIGERKKPVATVINNKNRYTTNNPIIGRGRHHHGDKSWKCNFRDCQHVL